MMLGSACSGSCDDCRTSYVGTCMAGHGDDDFNRITESEAIDVINKGWIKSTSKLRRLFEKFPDIKHKVRKDAVVEALI